MHTYVHIYIHMYIHITRQFMPARKFFMRFKPSSQFTAGINIEQNAYLVPLREKNALPNTPFEVEKHNLCSAQAAEAASAQRKFVSYVLNESLHSQFRLYLICCILRT